MVLTQYTQKITLPTSAIDLYTVLLDERKNSSFTGDFAQITDQEGASFTLYGGQVVGQNIILERGKKIVWSFRFDSPEWPQQLYSEAALILNPLTNNSCELELFHTAIPEPFNNRVIQFWNEQIWEPLTYYLER